MKGKWYLLKYAAPFAKKHRETIVSLSGKPLTWMTVIADTVLGLHKFTQQLSTFYTHINYNDQQLTAN